MSASPTSSHSSFEPVPRRKRVTAEHTLNRVRENQRRHRARRKDYISTLEQKLEETERQLEEARAEIARLRAERPTSSTQWNVGLIFQENTPGPTADLPTRMEDMNTTSSQAPIRPSTPLPTSRPSNSLIIPSPSLQIVANVPIPPGPPPCCLDEPFEECSTTDEVPNPNDPECRSCKTRPAPAPTESTTLCSQAYVLIAQQNFRGIDAATIRTWLFQGFRRARRKGEGCSIENTALMSLLDFISGCEERVGVPCGHQSAGGMDHVHDPLFG